MTVAAPGAPRAARRAAQVHTAAFYAAMFAVMGAHLPFWPIWLADWGLSAGEVGLFMTLGVATRVVAGLGFPVLADRLDRRRLVMVALCLAAAAVFAAHAAIGDRALLLVATLLTGAALAGVLPLGEALGAGAARAGGFAYGPVRAIGSVAFLVANLALGALIAPLGPGAVLWWIVAGLLLTAALGRRHPGGGTLRGHKPPSLPQIGRMLTHPVFLLFTLGIALSLSSHAVYYVYGSVHWRALGIADGTIGALWAFSVAVEIAVMLLAAPYLLRRIGPIGMMALSGIGGILRWGAMMFDPGVAWLWPLQAMHSLTFVAGHLGAIAFVQAAVPERYGASAQGAYLGLGGGVMTAVGMGLAAVVYPRAGGLTYGIAVAMSAAGLVLILRLRSRWRGAELDI
ncbi:MFS transporter [Rhodobacteraceae bacterium 2CG4]|uniref:MFS transporter n=1 Tax=Halovulum marinum TaxID=2662447 RepID=A0A6L5YUT7_9RHOB|nr:MFS transporter [Halovulum marinum]MSU88196.1 MFS transporter [Halovulum marinum]